MNIIEGVAISNLCDYSFGDQAGCIGRVEGSFMKLAHKSNEDFLDVYNSLKDKKEYMTLFIDNIRLYKRDIPTTNDYDRQWIDELYKQNDLLKMCKSFPKTKFIIFTNLEDTPINEDVHDRIPKNVVAIYGVNAIGFGDKVHPFPYGVQRILHHTDNRIPILNSYIGSDKNPKKLLYINHSEHTNLSERGNIREIFNGKSYVTIGQKVHYERYCQEILDHKFMICPQGNGVDCHRNWEVLYLGRVPIMKKTDYLMELYKEYPILWVDDFAKITKTLLLENNNLFIKAKSLDTNLLDLYCIFNRALKNAKNS